MRLAFDSPLAPDPVRISVRPGSMALAVGEEEGFSFDGEGRLLTISEGPVVYRRGLNHRMVAKQHMSGRRTTQDVDDTEKGRLVELALRRLEDVLLVLPESSEPEVRSRLEEAAAWTPHAYANDVRRFHSVYRPVGILPPDQYLSIVAQATEGCHYNRCTFCRFYQEMAFRVKTVEEFRAHLAGVRDFLGRGLSMRRSLFLADANALVATQRRLIGFFEVIGEFFDVAPPDLRGRQLGEWRRARPNALNGIYSFMDAFTGKSKSASELRELLELGLRRIYIGMESGNVPLLDWIQKPSKPIDVTELVATAREAGVHVGVIVMTGIGGHTFARGHVRDTVAALNALPLAAGDIIYLSPFREDTLSEYTRLARDLNLHPLTPEETATQTSAIRAGIEPRAGVQVSTYDLDEFIY